VCVMLLISFMPGQLDDFGKRATERLD